MSVGLQMQATRPPELQMAADFKHFGLLTG